MRQADYLVPKAWRARTVGMVVVAALTAALGLLWLAGQSEAAARSKFWLECPTTSVTEGDSVDVFLKRDPIPSDVNRNFYAYWHTDEGTASASNDYTPLNTVRQSTSDHSGARASNSLKRVIQTTQDPRVEHDETFTVRFTPTWNVRDMNDPDYDDKCEITIENDDRFRGDVETSTDGEKVTITLNEGLKDHLLLNWLVSTFDFALGLFYRAVFDVKVGDSWIVPEEADVSGRKITLTVDEPITEGQSVQVRYSNVFAVDSLGMFKNGAGITFPNFGATSGTNNSTVADADGGAEPSLELDFTGDIAISESTVRTIQVRLDSAPTDTVTVELSHYPEGTSSDYDSLFLEPDSLTFGRESWTTWQDVRVKGLEDSDAVNFWSLVTLSASGGGYDDNETEFRVLVYDDDLIHLQGDSLTESDEGDYSLEMDEASSATYGLKLKRRPAGRVEVSLDATWDGMTVSPEKLTFNKNNWQDLQTVTLTAIVDSNPSPRLLQVRHAPEGSGGDEANINQNIQDLDLNVTVQQVKQAE